MALPSSRRPGRPRLAAVLAAIPLLPAIWTGCGGTDRSVPRGSLITGSTGSDWYRIGSAIALRANRGFAWQPITAVSGAGGVSHPARVGKMPSDFRGVLQPLPAPRLRWLPSLPPPVRGPAHVASLIANTFQVIASPTLGISSLGEIKQRRLRSRIGTGPPGSGKDLLLRESLAALGFTYDDIQTWGGRIDLLGPGERADLFRDHHIELIAFNSNAPSSLLSEPLLSRPSPFIGLPEYVRLTLEDRWRVQRSELPAGTYPGQQEPVATVPMTFGIFTTAEIRDQLVYEVVRAIASHKEYLETVHVGLRTWTPQQIIQNGGRTTHPGAARYFKEQGWLP